MENINDICYNLTDWQINETSSKKTVFALLSEAPNESNTTQNSVIIAGEPMRIVASLCNAFKQDDRIKALILQAIMASQLYE